MKKKELKKPMKSKKSEEDKEIAELVKKRLENIFD